MEPSHYFNQESQDPKYYFLINGFVDKTKFSIWSAKGLFSADYFDLGTRILLKYFSFWQEWEQKFLDIGCGYGLVSTFIASQYIEGLYSTIKTLHIDACDVSPLAIDLATHNLTALPEQEWLSYHTHISDILSDKYFSDKSYSTIVINPPFSAGKKIVKQMIQQSYEHLAPKWALRIVVPTKKWAKSYVDRCRQEFGATSLTIQSLEAGYRVWTVEKLGTQ